MATKTIILGGGVGGVVTANALRAALPRDHEVVVIEKETSFHLGATKTWVMLGHRKKDDDAVWALGDVASVPLPGRYKPDAPLVLPKAAVFAAAQGRTVAARIAARALGKEQEGAFDGKGFCYVEMGGRHAMAGEGAFFETPAPRVVPHAPDLSSWEEKIAWADTFLRENFD